MAKTKKRRIVTVLVALLCMVTGARAENYPYRSGYLWVTVPDHADWLYKTGENAAVDVQLYKYGVPVTCKVEYEICDDMLPADSRGEAKRVSGYSRLVTPENNE